MSDAADGRVDEPEHYEFRVTGGLEPRWVAWFDGLAVTRQPDGTTVVSGPVADQSALHGVLQKLRDIGVPLISVTRIDRTSRAPHNNDSHEIEELS